MFTKFDNSEKLSRENFLCHGIITGISGRISPNFSILSGLRSCLPIQILIFSYSELGVLVVEPVAMKNKRNLSEAS